MHRRSRCYHYIIIVIVILLTSFLLSALTASMVNRCVKYSFLLALRRVCNIATKNKTFKNENVGFLAPTVPTTL